MKDKPTPTKTTAPSELQKEIYLRLISASAADGKFDLGNLTNAGALVKICDHLKGVSEILAVSFEGKLPAVTNDNNE
jgi:hypothetical protein